jgi:hypothetical protein
MATRRRRFAVCIRNPGCDDLVVGKIYEVLPDRLAAREQYLRVVDDSDEDYLYPADFFVAVDLPRAAERALSHAPR